MTDFPHRGVVIALTTEQILTRLWSMANHPSAPWFNHELPIAPFGFYRLAFPNGGTDPTAPDPFARWSGVGSTFVNITADCVALQAWAHGFDRLQKLRGAHIQGGAINCDFIREDIRRGGGVVGKCFRKLERPELGAMVVYESLPDSDDADHDRDGAGHIGGVVGVPAEWDPTRRECWQGLTVIDCASRTPALAVQRSTGLTWWGSRRDHMGKVIPKDAWFVVSTMTP